LASRIARTPERATWSAAMKKRNMRVAPPVLG
jgi:hypothetical protein